MIMPQCVQPLQETPNNLDSLNLSHEGFKGEGDQDVALKLLEKEQQPDFTLNTQCGLHSPQINDSHNSVSDKHCQTSDGISPAVTRKRSFKVSSCVSDFQEQYSNPPLQTKSTVASDPMTGNMVMIADKEMKQTSTKTRTKRVKLKMGGTSFRTVDKFWAPPISATKMDLNDKK